MVTETLPKYFGVHGTYEGYAPGLYVVRASSIREALSKLTQATVESVLLLPLDLFHHDKGHYNIDELQPAWEAIAWAIEDIEQKKTDYYVDLGRGVYYFEI